jgi:SNF2 family DNA or RNA helicase
VANPYKFDVLLTTYDTMRNEGALLGRIDWAICVADEAHRLKALDSFTSIAMRNDYRFNWLLMLTGTPVQNNLQEARAVRAAQRCCVRVLFRTRHADASASA